MSLTKTATMVVLAMAIFTPPLAGASGRKGLPIEPPRVVQPHKLVDQQARDVLFPADAGMWQLVVFGYTHCPDVCPMTLHKTALLLKDLGADSARLRVVFISIDSTRDDTKAMKSFVDKFDTRIVGLTGEPEALQAVANDFGILTRRFQGKTALAYTMVHSSLLYLLDASGRVRMIYPGGIEIEVLTADLRRLWQEDRTALR